MLQILHALARHAAERPAATAFVHGTGTLSYAALARRVAGAAHAAQPLPQTVGILAPNGLDWVVADLGLSLAGRSVVPLPTFFADSQLRHIVADAQLQVVLAPPPLFARVRALGAEPKPLPPSEAKLRPPEHLETRRITYTSGSTGAPKGVVLGSDALDAACRSLAQRVNASASDRHLSLLPFSLLLEEIAAILLPILVGGTCIIADEPAAGLISAAQVALTTTVLVPELLRSWVRALRAGQVEAPTSLRFVAVGGAAVPAQLAEEAWYLGLPVYEGYGLSECGSVVAVNAPGARRPGTVGRALPDYDLRIEDGEIIIRSPSVMNGYLGHAPLDPPGAWRTGDLGHIDADGYVTVLGRRDSMFVTSHGRNVSPEWIEALLLADPDIVHAVVFGAGLPQPVALLESEAGSHLQTSSARELERCVARLCESAPEYARPERILLLPPGRLAAEGLLTANGRPRRAAIAARFTILDSAT